VTILGLLVVVLAVEYLDLSGGTGSLSDRLEVDKSDEEEDESSDAFGFTGEGRRYTLPFLERDLPFRSAVGTAIAGYTVLAILVGLGPSSLAFVLLYTQMVDMNRIWTAGLSVFTVVVLYVFSRWLETPLFDGWIESVFLVIGVVG
jgi:hypothetical protein